MIIVAMVFVAFAVILCASSALALLGIGQLALSGPDAIERDGLARGELAPAWVLPDGAGGLHTSPPDLPLQLIIFADHSLKSFASVVAGLRALAERVRAEADMDLVVLTRGPAAQSRDALNRLGLAGIPVLTAGPSGYGRYNVRVMPFAIFVDSAGRVRASSLVNHDWQLVKLRQVAGIPLEPAELAAA